MLMMPEPELIEQWSHLKVYRDFEEAFCQVTGLSVRLRPLGIWNLACAVLRREGRFSSITVVPIWVGENIIGVLQTARAALQERIDNQLADHKNLVKNPNRTGNGHIAVFSRSRYEAMVHLLQIFAEQLSFYANQILIRLHEREPHRGRVARAFITDHPRDDPDLVEEPRRPADI